mgnify:CR=1 FL=1
MDDMRDDTREELGAKARVLGVEAASGLKDEDLRALIGERRRQNALAALKEIGVKAKASQTLEELEAIVLAKKLGDAGDPMNLPPCHTLRLLPRGYAENPVLDLTSSDCLRCIDLGTCKPADPRYAPGVEGAMAQEAVDEPEQEEQESDPGDWKEREDGARVQELGDGGVIVDETTKRKEPAAVVAAGETEDAGASPEEGDDMAKKKAAKKSGGKTAKKGAAKAAGKKAHAAEPKAAKPAGEKAARVRTSNGVPVALTDPITKKYVGQTLTKVWKKRGEAEPITLSVQVKEDGFYFKGEKYGSLSKIALVVTGQQRNGPAWFGLRAD